MPRLISPSACRANRTPLSVGQKPWAAGRLESLDGLVSGEEEEEKTTTLWLILCAQDHHRGLAGAKGRATGDRGLGIRPGERKVAGENGRTGKQY